jgi:hypothetical protein
MSGPVLLAAQAVALRARTGGLQAYEVDGMRVRAEELLTRDDPLRAAIYMFCTMYELDRHNAAAVALHGEELSRGVDRALRPDAPDAGRVDIHG